MPLACVANLTFCVDEGLLADVAVVVVFILDSGVTVFSDVHRIAVDAEHFRLHALPFFVVGVFTPA